MLSLFNRKKQIESSMDSRTRIKFLTYLIIGYLLLGLAWWTVLLYTKNKEAYIAKMELLKVGMELEGTYPGEAAFLVHPKYLELQRKYKRQTWMIYGEAGLLILSMSIGIWLMNRGYLREIEVAGQKRNFLLSITHELKSPLAAIKLVFDTIRRRKLNESQLQLLSDNGLLDTERLKSLVDNLLLAAQMEDNYIPGKEAYQLGEVVKPILDEINHRYKNAKISLHQNGNIVAEIEKQGIQIMMSNLIENAVKYAKDTPVIDVYIEEQDNKLIISVADQGIGIPEKEKEKVFDKFYRIGSEETRTTKGTGLGLYIVKGIVNAHNGKIKVLDNHPTGTIFKITLPKN